MPPVNRGVAAAIREKPREVKARGLQMEELPESEVESTLKNETIVKENVIKED